MTKVRIDPDEWYPVYSVVDSGRPYGHEVDATDEQIERWNAARMSFQAAQDEMHTLYERAANEARELAARIRAEKEAAEKAERERVAAERRSAQEERERKRDEMWRQIQESGGHVYDAKGNHIGTVRATGIGVSTGVALDPE